MIGELNPTALINHLWQSTLFALAAGLLTLAFRKNRAQVRYWLWFSASIKFFVPFALLVNLGSDLQRLLPWLSSTHNLATQIASPAVSFAMEEVSQPFPDTSSFAQPAQGAIPWVPIAIFGVWA